MNARDYVSGCYLDSYKFKNIEVIKLMEDYHNYRVEYDKQLKQKEMETESKKQLKICDMRYKYGIYNLLVNEQSAILDLLTILDVKNPKEKIKTLLDEQLFDVIECYDHGITKIRKKSTGEIFERGCRVYHKKYEKWVENIYFDATLIGTYLFEKYYKNYVCSNSEYYHLDDISLTDKTGETPAIQKEIVLNGITYVVKE